MYLYYTLGKQIFAYSKPMFGRLGKKCEIYSNLILNTPAERLYWCPDVFVDNLE